MSLLLYAVHAIRTLQCVAVCCSVLQWVAVGYSGLHYSRVPLTEEITIEIFGSLDLPDFLDLLSDGDAVYSRENLFRNLGTPVKPCLICMGKKKLLEILAVVIILCLILSVCGCSVELCCSMS